MEKQSKAFTYTYSAIQQDEVRKIYEQYIPKGEDNMAKLKRLDNSATRSAAAIAIAVGTLGFLVLAIGMCYMMIWSNYSLLGLLIAAPGLAAMIAAHPLYRLVVERHRKRIAPEVLALCKELMK